MPSQASKKKLARQPRKVEKKAVAAIARVEKAADKAEGKLAAARQPPRRSALATPRSPKRRQEVDGEEVSR